MRIDQTKMVTVRMSPDQHKRLAQRAAKQGISINTLALVELGFGDELPDALFETPRGRRPQIEEATGHGEPGTN